MDAAALEALFGLNEKKALTRDRSASSEKVDATKKAAASVQLFDMKRSNNVQIALSRLKLGDAAIKQAILDPASHPLTPEQLGALVSALPTAEEAEQVKEFAAGGGDADTLGRVESFFLQLADVPRLAPRLQALQVTQQLPEQLAALKAEVATVAKGCAAVKASKALRRLLQRVLGVGNYLNGPSNRGGASGFKLADLAKLVQVKSADSKTTLLHHLATLVEADLATATTELAAAEAARGVSMTEKKAELAKIGASLKLVQNEMAAGDGDADPFVSKLRTFNIKHAPNHAALQTSFAKAEAALKELAVWLAEKPTADIADVIGPISSFVKALAQAAKDNAREEEAERRKKEAPKESGPKKYGGVGMFPAKGDANMMLEMQLKMAKRAERAAEQAGGGGEQAQQQQWLKRAELQRDQSKEKLGVGDALAGGAASGAHFAIAARKRARQRRGSVVGQSMSGKL